MLCPNVLTCLLQKQMQAFSDYVLLLKRCPNIFFFLSFSFFFLQLFFGVCLIFCLLQKQLAQTIFSFSFVNILLTFYASAIQCNSSNFPSRCSVQTSYPSLFLTVQITLFVKYIFPENKTNLMISCFRCLVVIKYTM